MAILFKDRVKDTTTTTGTGTITITNSASSGFQTFNNAFGVGNSFFYCIEDLTNGAFEIGVGTLATSTTITRDEIYRSSNSNALVNFSAGTKTVFCTFIADTVSPHGLTLALSQNNTLFST